MAPIRQLLSTGTDRYKTRRVLTHLIELRPAIFLRQPLRRNAVPSDLDPNMIGETGPAMDSVLRVAVRDIVGITQGIAEAIDVAVDGGTSVLALVFEMKGRCRPAGEDESDHEGH